MRKFIAIAFTAAALAACDKSTSPTAPSAPSTAPTDVTTASGPVWPVKLPNGGEDPHFPPPPCACPAGFSVSYNGANFICRKPGGAAYEVVLPDLNVKTCKD